ncbi:MAG TPA: hypothetical protein VI258_03270, partial [Rhodanobacteraceae bacterium]
MSHKDAPPRHVVKTLPIASFPFRLDWSALMKQVLNGAIAIGDSLRLVVLLLVLSLPCVASADVTTPVLQINAAA